MVWFKGKQVGRYVADIVVQNQILLELKAVDVLTRVHEAQMLNYLGATGLRLGLLLNFGKERVESKRMVL
ncbi:GxxExxY protein [Desulfuromonas sp. DDH964]|uniref:GxxExxY protein n=1 Tax=Desulfuromonas sp. DDH964 TaxID=1823759 RepID=UPI00078C36A1|nr:hypothetical protein DBW_1519 [Desulfuromonas sp. DDH964]